MARFYSNENFPFAAVEILRAMGHDVLTTKDLGRAGKGVPDTEVLEFACSMERCVVTSDTDFLKLHKRSSNHCGIIYCTVDFDYQRLARHIHEKVQENPTLANLLFKVYKGQS